MLKELVGRFSISIILHINRGGEQGEILQLELQALSFQALSFSESGAWVLKRKGKEKL